MSPVPDPSACTCSSARESFTLARGPSCVPPEYVMASSCQPVDGSVMRCPLMSSEARVGTVIGSILRPAPEPEPNRSDRPRSAEHYRGRPGASGMAAQLEFWLDLAGVYVVPGAQFTPPVPDPGS